MTAISFFGFTLGNLEAHSLHLLTQTFDNINFPNIRERSSLALLFKTLPAGVLTDKMVMFWIVEPARLWARFCVRLKMPHCNPRKTD